MGKVFGREEDGFACYSFSDVNLIIVWDGNNWFRKTDYEDYVPASERWCLDLINNAEQNIQCLKPRAKGNRNRS